MILKTIIVIFSYFLLVLYYYKHSSFFVKGFSATKAPRHKEIGTFIMRKSLDYPGGGNILLIA
jgi:hypothetical protein